MNQMGMDICDNVKGFMLWIKGSISDMSDQKTGCPFFSAGYRWHHDETGTSPAENGSGPSVRHSFSSNIQIFHKTVLK